MNDEFITKLFAVDGLILCEDEVIPNAESVESFKFTGPFRPSEKEIARLVELAVACGPAGLWVLRFALGIRASEARRLWRWAAKQKGR